MKVTGIVVIIFVISLLSCQVADNYDERLAFQQQVDSIASKKIDSAYHAIAIYCDSAAPKKVALLVDSLLKADTLRKANL